MSITSVSQNLPYDIVEKIVLLIRAGFNDSYNPLNLKANTDILNLAKVSQSWRYGTLAMISKDAYILADSDEYPQNAYKSMSLSIETIEKFRSQQFVKCIWFLIHENSFVGGNIIKRLNDHLTRIGPLSSVYDFNFVVCSRNPKENKRVDQDPTLYHEFDALSTVLGEYIPNAQSVSIRKMTLSQVMCSRSLSFLVRTADRSWPYLRSLNFINYGVCPLNSEIDLYCNNLQHISLLFCCSHTHKFMSLIKKCYERLISLEIIVVLGIIEEPSIQDTSSSSNSSLVTFPNLSEFKLLGVDEHSQVLGYFFKGKIVFPNLKTFVCDSTFNIDSSNNEVPWDKRKIESINIKIDHRCSLQQLQRIGFFKQGAYPLLKSLSVYNKTQADSHPLLGGRDISTVNQADVNTSDIISLAFAQAVQMGPKLEYIRFGGFDHWLPFNINLDLIPSELVNIEYLDLGSIPFNIDQFIEFCISFPSLRFAKLQLDPLHKDGEEMRITNNVINDYRKKYKRLVTGISTFTYYCGSVTQNVKYTAQNIHLLALLIPSIDTVAVRWKGQFWGVQLYRQICEYQKSRPFAKFRQIQNLRISHFSHQGYPWFTRITTQFPFYSIDTINIGLKNYGVVQL